MHRLSGVASVARALLMLERSHQAGAFDLATVVQRYRLRVVGGRIVEARCGTTRLQPVTSALAGAFREGVTGYRFAFQQRPSAPAVDLRTTPTTGYQLIDAMRMASAVTPLQALLGAVGERTLHLTAAGQRLSPDAAFSRTDLCLFRALSRGANLTQIRRAMTAAGLEQEPALRTVAALQRLALVGDDQPRDASYSLLLRKRQQVRASVGPHALLDIPPDAPPPLARRALRRLARKLHPDRLGPHAPTALLDASGEVLGALIRAETSVRTHSA